MASMEPNNNTSAALLEENRSLRRIIQEKDLRILELEKQLGFIQTQPQNPIEKITETIIPSLLLLYKNQV